MNTIGVVMSFKSILISSLLVAFLPVVILFVGEFLVAKSVNLAGAIVGLVVFVALQGYVVFQGISGCVSLDKEMLHVRSGFYSASWPNRMLQVVSEEQADMANSTRVNGVAMYGIRAGWFRVASRDIFVLATTDERLCLAQDAKVLVCLDREVVEQLRPTLEG
jgi:hypothetical protein